MSRSTLLGIAIVSALAGCFLPRSGYERASATADRTEAYRDNLVRLRTQVGLTTSSLRALTENPGDSPRSNKETFQTFARELANLEALADRSRRTYGKMDARAELFFGQWITDTAAITSSELKESAEARRTALQASYEGLAQGQLDLDLALERYVREIGDLRIYLEHDLTAAGLSSAQVPIEKAFADGAALQDQLGELAHAADQARAGLTPLKALAPSQDLRSGQEARVR
jgi:hypothetical protein